MNKKQTSITTIAIGVLLIVLAFFMHARANAIEPLGPVSSLFVFHPPGTPPVATVHWFEQGDAFDTWQKIKWTGVAVVSFLLTFSMYLLYYVIRFPNLRQIRQLTERNERLSNEVQRLTNELQDQQKDSVPVEKVIMWLKGLDGTTDDSEPIELDEHY